MRTGVMCPQDILPVNIQIQIQIVKLISVDFTRETAVNGVIPAPVIYVILGLDHLLQL